MKIARAEILLALAVAAGIAAASYWGLPHALGAHPWWAAQSGMIGAALGFVLFVAARAVDLGPKALLYVAVFTVLTALASAHFGKSAFVAAEDFNPLAGKAWYFGWIGLAAASGILVTSLLALFRARK